MKNLNILTVILILIAVSSGVSALWFYRQVAGLQSTIVALNAKLNQTEADLNQLKGENGNLANSLATEKQLTNEYTGRISSLSSTVSSYERLHHLDPELLKKYSKVYFLNENYEPVSLTTLATTTLYDQTKVQKLYTNVVPYFNKLIGAALTDGVSLRVISAYRSFGTQAALKSQYKVVYGSGANQFSSDQGYSEHQLGTAVDLTTSKVQPLVLDFAKTPAYEWLQTNAYKYGFVLSYPRQNSYYQFEPWHWRFVGIELATKLHNEGKYFYDLDQHEIDAYLIKLFDL